MSTAPCSRSPRVRNSSACLAGCRMLIARIAEEREGALALISGRPLAAARPAVPAVARRRSGSARDRAPACRRHARPRSRQRQPKPRSIASGRSLLRSRPATSGLILEDKGGTLALHYRAAPEREPEIRAYAEALQRDAAAALRLIAGKMVVEFQPLAREQGFGYRGLSGRAARSSDAARSSSAMTPPTRTVLPKSAGGAASAIRVGPPARDRRNSQPAFGCSGPRLARENRLSRAAVWLRVCPSK